jgi:hypothetical protein
MKAHLQAVGVIDVATGVVFTVLGVLVSLGVLLFAPWFYGAPLWTPEDEVIVFAVVLFVGAVFLAIGIPNLVAGSALLKQKPWARVLAIILAALALTSFPAGTAVGIYTIWVLTHKETEQLISGAASVGTGGLPVALPPEKLM